jgi:hypothetical protein
VSRSVTRELRCLAWRHAAFGVRRRGVRRAASRRGDRLLETLVEAPGGSLRASSGSLELRSQTGIATRTWSRSAQKSRISARGAARVED